MSAKITANTKLEIVVRFSSGSVQDLSIPVDPKFTITSTYIRKTIRAVKKKDIGNKRLRLIYNGKVLNEQTNFSKDIFKPRLKLLMQQDTSEEDVVKKGGEEPDEHVKIYIHCLIGDELTAEELLMEDKLDKQQETSTEPAPIGFDRLLQAGFSQTEIQELRQQFTSLYGDLNSRRSGDGAQDIRQLEERWIDSTVNNEVDDFNNINMGSTQLGGNEDLLLGLLFGCFLGLLSLFFIKDENLFSKRQRMAIVGGIVVNFTFGLVRQWT